MCILFLAVKQHPDYPLIVCANRDEFYDRPTLSAGFWSSNPEMLAGKDLRAGGSWLGVTKNGSFAAVTNIRNTKSPMDELKSRGELVTKALQKNSPINFEWLKRNSDFYGPFNLVYGYFDQLFCYHSPSKTQQELGQGFHSVSNGAMDDVWPKMEVGIKKLQTIVDSNARIHKNQLLDILEDNTQANKDNLPDTGIPKNWEKLLSSIFIESENYGTRSSSLVRVQNTGMVTFDEVQHVPFSQDKEIHSYRFQQTP